jgi:hypothetical protein
MFTTKQPGFLCTVALFFHPGQELETAFLAAGKWTMNSNFRMIPGYHGNIERLF